MFLKFVRIRDERSFFLLEFLDLCSCRLFLFGLLRLAVEKLSIKLLNLFSQERILSRSLRKLIRFLHRFVFFRFLRFLFLLLLFCLWFHFFFDHGALVIHGAVPVVVVFILRLRLGTARQISAQMFHDAIHDILCPHTFVAGSLEKHALQLQIGQLFYAFDQPLQHILILLRIELLGCLTELIHRAKLLGESSTEHTVFHRLRAVPRFMLWRLFGGHDRLVHGFDRGHGPGLDVYHRILFGPGRLGDILLLFAPSATRLDLEGTGFVDGDGAAGGNRIFPHPLVVDASEP